MGEPKPLMKETYLSKTVKDIDETLLMINLRELSLRSESGLYQQVKDIIKLCKPILDRIPAGPFITFTSHDSSHSLKLVKNIGEIISPETLGNLSEIDLAIIILSCYIHDIGMSIPHPEFEKAMLSKELKTYTLNHFPHDADANSIINKWHGIKDNIAGKGDANESAISEDNAIAYFKYQICLIALCKEYRAKHATNDVYINRLKDLEESSQDFSLFSYRGQSFRDILIQVCVSHNLEANSLRDYTSRYTLIDDAKINVQLCSALLRIADILDFDAERTPDVIFRALSINERIFPKGDITRMEWLKHKAITSVEINPEKTFIVINARCFHPAIEKSIRDFCDIIQNEIRDTTSVLTKENRSMIDIPLIVIPIIESKGYIYQDVSFRFNDEAIFNLLMSREIYNDDAAAVRELIQNSIDACLVRQNIESGYNPQIQVFTETDSSENTWLVVKDNGIGMDADTIKNYFLKIGSSYYDSSWFKEVYDKRINKKESNNFSLQRYDSNARFGIGFLSAFLLCDYLEVKTRRIKEISSDTKCRTIIIENKWSIVVTKECNDGDEFEGTEVKLLLRKEPKPNLTSLMDYIKLHVIRPQLSVNINFGVGKKHTCRSEEFMTSLNYSVVDAESKPITIELSAASDSKIRGHVILYLFKNPDASFSLFRDNMSNAGKKSRSIEKISPLTGKRRITVKGFKMSLPDKIKILRDEVYGAFDIDIVNTQKVRFNVSRTDIRDDNSELRKYLTEIIVKAIVQNENYNTLDLASRQLVKRRFIPIKKNIDNELLEIVKLEVKDLFSTLELKASQLTIAISFLEESLGLGKKEAEKYLKLLNQ